MKKHQKKHKTKVVPSLYKTTPEIKTEFVSEVKGFLRYKDETK